MNNNDLNEFPKVFHNHPNVKHLNLSNNLIKRLDNLPENITTLEVIGNNLEDISDISKLHKLEELQLETCSLTNMPNHDIFTGSVF